MILLDTHSWIWWIDQSPHLSQPAKRAIAGISSDQPALVSSISVWELYMLVSKGRLVLKVDPAHWVRQCELSERIRFVPVDNEIARIAVGLSSRAPEDPADRMIIASALATGATLVTKDARIQKCSLVKTLW